MRGSCAASWKDSTHRPQSSMMSSRVCCNRSEKHFIHPDSDSPGGRLCIGHPQAVPEPCLRDNVLRPRRVLLELLPKILHTHSQTARVTQSTRPPDFLDELIGRHDHARLSREALEHSVL